MGTMTTDNTPTLPDNVSIPPRAIEDWLRLNEHEPLEIQLNRLTVDHLFFALVKLADAQAEFQQCLISYSQGDTPSANVKLASSQTLLVEGRNRLNQFMTNVMLEASRGRHG